MAASRLARPSDDFAPRVSSISNPHARNSFVSRTIGMYRVCIVSTGTDSTKHSRDGVALQPTMR
eukprot:2311822-Prymnesium_polylepis.1